jgi:hypothetical protein
MLLLDMDKKVDLREFISALQNRTHQNAVVFKGALNSENASGPCRDRTDDPQIKSVSEEDDSKPD